MTGFRTEPSTAATEGDPRRAVMRMQWFDLLFAHWSPPVEKVAALIPPPFELDTFEGRAWVALVPFGMRDVSPVGLPRLPWRGVTDFLECNVRTYVRHGKRSGVWFFSLDAASRLAVWGARRTYHLPYFHARIEAAREGDRIEYAVDRLETPRGSMSCAWRAGRALEPSLPGTLVHFLTERYWLFTRDSRGRPLGARVWHEPWSLREATLDRLEDGLISAAGLGLPDEAPLLHHADHIAVRASRPVRPT